ncbi:hypothetical protein PsYK624_107360 [Phanerochaete sordida]|uniref:Uncharacterized protein n=1 Tax=Phanerochaete sordida TaxID=48140 RepID=A0A9P3GGL1_9APHY|nr:hypothetical protein PsYK624_107360 [Phanerochaete sordida]
MQLTGEPPCPEWEPLTDQGRCPATPSDDVAFTAGSTFSWRKLRCGINLQGNHYCTFEFYTPQLGLQHTYRYYNANGSYYYKASNSKGFFFHPETGMRHISSYDAQGTITGREYLPAEDEDLMDSLVDALPEYPLQMEERFVRVGEHRVAEEGEN